MPSPFRLQISLNADPMDTLQKQAQELKITAASLARERILNQQPQAFNSRTFATAVEAAASTIPGLPRPQIEHLVAKVITTLATPG